MVIPNKKKIEELYFIIGSELQAMNRQDLYFEFSEFLLKESKSLSDKVLEGHSHYFKFKFYYYHFNDFLAKEELNQALKKYAELKNPSDSKYLLCFSRIHDKHK